MIELIFSIIKLFHKSNSNIIPTTVVRQSSSSSPTSHMTPQLPTTSTTQPETVTGPWNNTDEATPRGETLNADDVAWNLACAFIIFTMQTGFAMLESGTVSPKNVTNIMIKNVVDVSIGGLGYWMYGYALSFGEKSNSFVGYSDFFFRMTPENSNYVASKFTHYFFQLSFATTATTIVSGAAAERMTLKGYIVFSFFNNIVYSMPSAWVWHHTGFLKNMGFYDFAGAGVVHACGGASALIAAITLGPRTGRYEEPEKFGMSSPVTALTGMFMLWWSWLGFNCGSTFSMANPGWRIAAVVSVITLNGAIGGGCIGIAVSMGLTRGKILVDYILLSVLGGLVAITGIAPLTNTIESLFIGGVGGLVAIGAFHLLHHLKIDDPVAAAPVHLFAGAWGVICIGLHADGQKEFELEGYVGLFHGGGFRLLGLQTLGFICIFTWSASITFILLKMADKLVGIRVSLSEEVLGADWVEHDLKTERMSNRIENALKNLDEPKLERLILEVLDELHGQKHKMRRLSDRNRIFSVDLVNGGIDADFLTTKDQSGPGTNTTILDPTTTTRIHPSDDDELFERSLTPVDESPSSVLNGTKFRKFSGLKPISFKRQQF